MLMVASDLELKAKIEAFVVERREQRKAGQAGDVGMDTSQ